MNIREFRAKIVLIKTSSTIFQTDTKKPMNHFKEFRDMLCSATNKPSENNTSSKCFTFSSTEAIGKCSRKLFFSCFDQYRRRGLSALVKDQDMLRVASFITPSTFAEALIVVTEVDQWKIADSANEKSSF